MKTIFKIFITSTILSLPVGVLTNSYMLPMIMMSAMYILSIYTNTKIN